VFSVTTIIGLSHITNVAASFHDIPGRTPTTSSIGAPAARGFASVAGHFTLPRISLATCSALASPVGAGVAASTAPIGASLLFLEPQPAIASAASTQTEVRNWRMVFPR
jgi:hypothetical protein